MGGLADRKTLFNPPFSSGNDLYQVRSMTTFWQSFCRFLDLVSPIDLTLLDISLEVQYFVITSICCLYEQNVGWSFLGLPSEIHICRLSVISLCQFRTVTLQYGLRCLLYDLVGKVSDSACLIASMILLQ